MTKKGGGKKFEVELDFYYLRKESFLRGLLVLLVVLAAAGIGIYAWKQRGLPEAQAQRMLSEAEAKLKCARETPGASRHQAAIESASRKLAESRIKFDRRLFDEAVPFAKEALQLVVRVCEGTTRDLPQDATVVDTAGKVEVQRANKGFFEPARQGMKLYEGDFVRTGTSGGAEIMACDGTFFKVKTDSLLEIHKTNCGPPSGAEGQVPEHNSRVKIITGTVDLDTGEGTQTRVDTDSARTTVGQRSSVGVDVDASKNTSISTYKGRSTIRTGGGDEITLSDREGITASKESGKLSAKVRIPESPSPLQPEDNVQYDIQKREPVSLRWSRVPEAARYRLQIARSRLFIPESIIVDMPDRVRTDASVSVRDEGSFFWRIATIGKSSQQSEWSAYRRFKVQGASAERLDKKPPLLSVNRPQAITNIVQVSGKTDPGCTVTVNGEQAEVDGAGNFKKIISLKEEGLQPILVKSTNGAGLTSERVEKVMIQF